MYTFTDTTLTHKKLWPKTFCKKGQFCEGIKWKERLIQPLSILSLDDTVIRYLYVDSNRVTTRASDGETYHIARAIIRKINKTATIIIIIIIIIIYIRLFIR